MTVLSDISSMVRTLGWFAASASASLAMLSLLVLYIDGVGLTASLALIIVVGSIGLVVLLSQLHPHPAVALADRRLHAVFGTIPILILVLVSLSNSASVTPIGAEIWPLLFWVIAGMMLFYSAANEQARHYHPFHSTPWFAEPRHGSANPRSLYHRVT